jgi:hypothetical protein
VQVLRSRGMVVPRPRTRRAFLQREAGDRAGARTASAADARNDQRNVARCQHEYEQAGLKHTKVPTRKDRSQQSHGWGKLAECFGGGRNTIGHGKIVRVPAAPAESGRPWRLKTVGKFDQFALLLYVRDSVNFTWPDGTKDCLFKAFFRESS